MSNYRKVAAVILFFLPLYMYAQAQEPFRDQVVLSFQYSYPLKEKVKEVHFVLTRTEFDRGVFLHSGDVKGFLRKYLLDKFLEIEMEKHEGEFFPDSLFNMGKVRRLPFLSEEETDPHRMLAKEAVLHFLLEKKLRLSGRSRDDFGPHDIYQHYLKAKMIFENFMKEHPENTLQTKDWIKFQEEYPEMKALVIFPSVQIQGVWLRIPSIKEYEKLAPEKWVEANAKIQKWYDAVFSLECLKWMKEEAIQTSKSRRLQGVLVDVIESVFKASRQILSEEKSKFYPPLLAVDYAVETAIGQYLVLKKNDLTPEERELIHLLLTFVRKTLKEKIKDIVFNGFEKRRSHMVSIYEKMTKKINSIEKKSLIFRMIVDEFYSEAQAEQVLIEPTWIEQGRNQILPSQIEKWLFGGERRQPGEIETHYALQGVQPSLTVFQWLAQKRVHFMNWNEKREGKSVGQLLQDQLVFKFSNELRPQVEAELFEAYRPYIQFWDIPG